MKYCLVLAALLLAACSSKDDVFDKSPSQRSSESITALESRTCECAYGWRVLYFPKTDAVVLQSVGTDLSTWIQGHYGYGGDCFTMKFAADNTVEMWADFTDQTAAEAVKSEYLIGRNSFTQLSFSTYNYIHRLVNDRFAGASDFFIWARMRMETLCFARLLTPAAGTRIHSLHQAEKRGDNRLRAESL